MPIRSRRTLPAPIYAISPDGRWAIAPDFRRLHDMRPGYGYTGIPDPNAGVNAPDDAGIWRLDRDRPLWRHPGLWRAARAVPPADEPSPLPGALAAGASPPARSGLPRLVLAFHYPWYGTPDGPARRWRHWNHPIYLLEGQIQGFHDPRRQVAPGRLDVGALELSEELARVQGTERVDHDAYLYGRESLRPGGRVS